MSRYESADCPKNAKPSAESEAVRGAEKGRG